jgi:hypothetical protein
MLVDATRRSPRPRRRLVLQGTCACTSIEGGLCRGLERQDLISSRRDVQDKVDLFESKAAYSHQKRPGHLSQRGWRSPSGRVLGSHPQTGRRRTLCQIGDEAGCRLGDRRSSGCLRSFGSVRPVHAVLGSRITCDTHSVATFSSPGLAAMVAQELLTSRKEERKGCCSSSRLVQVAGVLRGGGDGRHLSFELFSTSRDQAATANAEDSW